MAGDEHVRYCSECKLHVYNFSEMSDADIERIVAQRSGRLCARFYQRSDGTMITRNCPVGLRAATGRVLGFASAALAAIMSIGPAFAGAATTKHDFALLQILPAQTGLTIEVADATGAVVAKAKLTITNEKTKVKVSGETDESGQLRLTELPAGTYEITITVPGFQTLKQNHVAVPARIPLKLKVEVAAIMGEVVAVKASH
jgi:carboxypeptidase family protein